MVGRCGRSKDLPPHGHTSGLLTRNCPATLLAGGIRAQPLGVTMNQLIFHDTSLEITDLHGQAWLRGAQIGAALGYAHPDRKVRTLFDRHRNEFTAEMTALVDLPTAGGMQETRIFSLRGARLLAMHARTSRAAEFRAWVLDLLDGMAATSSAKAERDVAVQALLTIRPRLRRVAELRALGLSRKEIAGAVGVAVSTLHHDLTLLGRIGLVPPGVRSTALARMA